MKDSVLSYFDLDKNLSFSLILFKMAASFYIKIISNYTDI